MPRFRELDGLRGIWAFLLVVVHAGVPGTDVLYVFMDGFFAMSAFVITFSLLHQQGSFITRLNVFFRRRAARILPGYYITALAGIAIAATVNAAASRLGMAPVYDLSNVADYLVFLQFTPLYWTPDFQYQSLHILDHTWSLAIEEQFYLVGGVLLIWLRAVAFRWLVAALCIVIGVHFRDQQGNASLALYHMDAFGYGILAAQLFALHASNLLRKTCLTRVAGLLFIVSFIAYLAFSQYPAAWLTWIQGGEIAYLMDWHPLTIFTSLGCGALVLWLALMSGTQSVWLLRQPIAVFFGRISYALYLSHFLLVDPGFRTGVFERDSAMSTLSILALSISIAYFFTQLLEHLQGRINGSGQPRTLFAGKHAN